MTEEQEEALQRIKDPSYIKCEGSEKDIELLHFLLEGVANSEWGAKVILQLKKQKDLPDDHRVVIGIKNDVSVGLSSAAAGVHHGDGSIELFKKGEDLTDKEVLGSLAYTLSHELYHETQDQQGLHGPFKNFTPEQNFIINRLVELDAASHGSYSIDYIREAFEGLGGGSFYAGIYNEQALVASFNGMSETAQVSDKSFEEVRNTLVKRLGVDIDPEYFSVQTLESSDCGKSFFQDGKLPIQQEHLNIGNGKLSIYKHPEEQIKCYKSNDGMIEIEERLFEGGISRAMVFSKSKKTILSINQEKDLFATNPEEKITNVQTEKNPSECRDVHDFRRVVSQMSLPKDVCDAFNFNPKKVEDFIVSSPKENSFSITEFLAKHSSYHKPKESKKTEITPQVLDKVSRPRGG